MRSREAALANCLSAMEAGQSLDDCLTRYPGHASELQTLLTLANDVRRVPVPRPRSHVKAAHAQRMLAAVAARSSTPPTPASQPKPPARLLASLSLRPAMRWAAIMVVVLVLSGAWASVTTADHSLPGDILYPVKRAGERVQLSLTFDPTGRHRLQEEFYRERLEETQDVLTQRRQTKVDFVGSLTEIADDYWLVAGFTVRLTSDTEILGQPELGRQVQVQALAMGAGELKAVTLRVSPMPVPEASATPRPLPSQTPSPTPSRTATPSPTLAPQDTPTPTLVLPAEEPEVEQTLPTATALPRSQKPRHTSPPPSPTGPPPGLTPSVTPRSRVAPKRSPTASPTGTPPRLRPRTRTPERTRSVQPLRTRMPERTPPQPPLRTREPEPPPPQPPLRTRDPGPEPPQPPSHTRDPGPEPPRPRPRLTRRP